VKNTIANSIMAAREKKIQAANQEQEITNCIACILAWCMHWLIQIQKYKESLGRIRNPFYIIYHYHCSRSNRGTIIDQPSYYKLHTCWEDTENISPMITLVACCFEIAISIGSYNRFISSLWIL